MATPLMTGPPEDRARLQAALDEQVLRALTPVAGATSIIYGASAVNIMLTWPAPTRLLTTVLYASMALVGLVLLWFHGRGRVRARYANATIGTLLFASAGFTALNLLAPRSMEQLVAGIIGPLVAGVLLLHWRWFYVVSLAHVGAATAVAVAMELPSIASFLVVLAASVGVGALLHMVRSRNATRIESLLATNETQRKTLERALHDLHATQEEALRREKLSALGTLVAGVAHEINNPLTYMRGNVELTQMTLDEASRDGQPISAEAASELAEQQAAVLRGIDRIAHITQSLRSVARPASTATAPENVNAIVEGVLTIATARTPTSIEVVRDLQAQAPAQVNATDISQVVLNLVLNALDAMPGGGRLRLSTRDEADRIVIEVGDTGPGIAPEVRARLFTPFFTTKHTGTGLGLSISHQIVEQHGGSIEIDNAPAGGAIVRVALPIAPGSAIVHAQGS